MEIDRKAELESEKRQVLRIIKSKSTIKKTLFDYPLIKRYLQDKFPEIDITDISIYVTSPRVMSSCKFLKNCAGVYIPSIKTILMKNIVHMMGGSTEGLFNKLLSKEKIKTEVEDILVHEAMHAISAAANRSLGIKQVNRTTVAKTIGCFSCFCNRDRTGNFTLGSAQLETFRSSSIDVDQRRSNAVDG